MGDKSPQRSRLSDNYDDVSEESLERGGSDTENYKGRSSLRGRGFRRGSTDSFRPSRSRFSRTRAGITRRGGSRGVSGYHSYHYRSARSHSSERRRRSRTRSRSKSRTPLGSRHSGRYYPSKSSDRYRSKLRSRSRNRRSRTRSRSKERRTTYRSRSHSRSRFSRSPFRSSSVRLYSPGRRNNDGGREFRSGVGASLTDLSVISYSESFSSELTPIVDHRQDRITSENEEFLRITVDNDHFTSNSHLWKPVGHETSLPSTSYSQESPHFNTDNEYTSQQQQQRDLIAVEGISSWDLIDISDEEEEEEIIQVDYNDESFEIEDMGPGRNWDRRSDRDYRGRGGGYGKGGRGGRNDRSEHVSSIVPKHTSSIVPKNSVREEVWKIPKVLSARDMDAYDDDVHCERYAVKVREQPKPVVVDIKPKVEPMYEVKCERRDLFGGDDDYEMKYDPKSALAATTSVFSSSSSFFERESSRASSSNALPGLGFEESVSQTRASHSRSFLTSSNVGRSTSPPCRSPKPSSETDFAIPGLGNIGNMNADEEDEFLYGDDDDDDDVGSKGGIPGLGGFSTPMTSSERRSSTSSHSRQSAVPSSDPRNLGKILKNLGYDAVNSTLGSSAKNNNDRNQKRTEHVAREITDLYHRLHDGSDMSDGRIASDPRSSNHRVADPRSSRDSSHGISDPRSSRDTSHGISDPRSSNQGTIADPRLISSSQGPMQSSDHRLQSRQVSLDGNEKNLAASYPLPVHQEVATAPPPPAPAYHNQPHVTGQYSEYPPDLRVNSTQPPPYDSYQYGAYYAGGYSVPPPPLPTVPAPPLPPPPPHQHLPIPVSNYQIPPPQPLFPSFPPPSVSIPISTTETKWQPQPVESQINRNNLKVVPIQATSTLKTPVVTSSVEKPLDQSKGPEKKDGPPVPTTLEERMHLKGEYAQQQKKLELLRVELERSRRQQGELMRKKQKQKDGHNDPQLLKNGKLQDDYKRQIYNVEITLSGIEKALKASEGLIRSSVSSRSDYSSSPRRDSRDTKSTNSNSKTQVPNKQYRFVDSGDNWCAHCGNTYPLATDLLKHLHSDHANLTDNIAPADRAWAVKPKEPKPTSVREISVKPFQGVEFMLPCLAYFCKLCREFSGDHIAARTHLESEKHNANYQKLCQTKPDYLKKLQADRSASAARKREEKKRKVEQELKDAVAAKKKKANVTVTKKDSDMEISDEDDVLEIQPSANIPIRLILLNEKDGVDNKPELTEEVRKSSTKIAMKLKELATSLPSTSKESLATTPAVADQQRTQQRILSNLYKNKKKNKEKSDVRVQQPPLEEFVSLATVSCELNKSNDSTVESKTLAQESPVKITPHLPKDPESVSITSFTAEEMELLPPGVDHISINVPMASSKSRQAASRLGSTRKSVEEDCKESVPAEFGPRLPDTDFDDEQGLDNVLNSILLPDVLDNILMKDIEEENTDDSSLVNLTDKKSGNVKHEKELSIVESKSAESISELATEKETACGRMNVAFESGNGDTGNENGEVNAHLEKNAVDVDNEHDDQDVGSLEKGNVNMSSLESVKETGEVVREPIKDTNVDSTIGKQQTENNSIVGIVDTVCDRIMVTSQDVVQDELKRLTPPQSKSVEEAGICTEEHVTNPINIKMEVYPEEPEQEQVLEENNEEEVDVKPDVRLLDEAIARSRRPQRARCSRGRGRVQSVPVLPMLAKVKIEPGLENIVESNVVSSKISCRGKTKRGRPRRGARNVETCTGSRNEQAEVDDLLDKDGLQANQEVPVLGDPIDEQTGSSFKEETDEKSEVSVPKVKSKCDMVLETSRREVSTTKPETEGECEPSSPAASDLSFGDMEVLDEAEDSE